MPYCDDCERFYTPNSMRPDGRCPACGLQLAEPQAVVADDEEEYRAPWHFKLMVVALVVYLGWRAWQLVERFV
ncbi:MAG: hypothetical protein ACRD29_07680 [Acidimicrobiales bacterium]